MRIPGRVFVVAGAAAVCFASAYGAASLKQQHADHHAKAVHLARTHTVRAPVVQNVSFGAAEVPGLRVKRPAHASPAATTTAVAPAVHTVAAAARAHPLRSVPATAPRHITPAPRHVSAAPITPTPAHTPTPPASTPAPTRTTAPAPSQQPAASDQPGVSFFDGG
jgi:hypothetical protein